MCLWTTWASGRKWRFWFWGGTWESACPTLAHVLLVAAVLGPRLESPWHRFLLPIVIHAPGQFWYTDNSDFQEGPFKKHLFPNVEFWFLPRLEKAIKVGFLFTLSHRLSWQQWCCVYYNTVISVDVYDESVISHWLFLPFAEWKDRLLSGPSVTGH